MGAVKGITICPVRCFDGDGNELFSKTTAQSILGIHHRQTFNEHLETLKINPGLLKWSDIKAILELKLFLYSRMGGNTRQMYKKLKSKALIPRYFALNNIDLDAQFTRIKDIYEAKNPISGSTRHTQNGAFTNPPKPQTAVPVMV